MQYRTLGANGPRVSAIGLGCMGMSAFYGAHDDSTSIKTLHYALDQGVRMFDMSFNLLITLNCFLFHLSPCPHICPQLTKKCDFPVL